MAKPSPRSSAYCFSNLFGTAVKSVHRFPRKYGALGDYMLLGFHEAVDVSVYLQGYLFNHTALAKVFRAKILAGIDAAGLALPGCTPKQWVVDCKSVGSGTSTIIYLGRYLYRGVIQEKDIVACQDGQVTFRYRDAKTGTSEYRTVPGAQFLWLVLQHVLPKGFRRARNFGFLHPNCKRLIALLQVLLRFVPVRAADWVKPRPPTLCTCCGAVMKIVRTRIAGSIVGEPVMSLAVGVAC